MTVQELIDFLQNIENKSAVVTIFKPEYGIYDDYIDPIFTQIPSTYVESDDGNEYVSKLDSVVF